MDFISLKDLPSSRLMKIEAKIALVLEDAILVLGASPEGAR